MDLEVEGQLPAALNGAFARNGPNLYYPPTAGYHWCVTSRPCWLLLGGRGQVRTDLVPAHSMQHGSMYGDGRSETLLQALSLTSRSRAEPNWLPGHIQPTIKSKAALEQAWGLVPAPHAAAASILTLASLMTCCRFDGDGMMHVVRIKDGKASYCNRFVDTIHLQMEKAAGYPVKIKVGGPACPTWCSSLVHWMMSKG